MSVVHSIIDGMDGAVPHITQRELPVANVFVRRGGVVHHFWSSELFRVPNAKGLHPRHVDFMWPVWAVFDRTPEGRGTDWNPELVYPA